MSDPAKKGQLRLAARTAFDSAYCDRATLPQFDAVIDRLLGKTTDQQAQAGKDTQAEPCISLGSSAC